MDEINNNSNSSLGKGLGALIPQKTSDATGATPAARPAQPTAPLAGAGSPAVLPVVPPPEAEAWAREAEMRERERREAVRPAAPAAKAGGGKMPDAIFQIEVEKIQPNPSQPRRHFDETSIKELASSIREFGLLQPIVVTKTEREVPSGTEVDYTLISGERRLQAAKILGMERIPAIIRNVQISQERLELAVIENIQRENLNPIEMARAFSRLADEFRLTQREIATRLGKSRETVANTLRLLDLGEDMRRAIEDNTISESHGRLLLTIDDPAVREKLFRDLIERGLTTRELRVRAKAAQGAKTAHRPHAALPPEMKMLEERLSSELGAPVRIEKRKSIGGAETAAGTISISFYSEEELTSIAHKLSGPEQN